MSQSVQFRWRCDSCKTKYFASFEEACHHEQQCRWDKKPVCIPKQSKPVHRLPSDLSTETSQPNVDDCPNEPIQSMSQKWRCDYCKVRFFATLEEANEHEQQCRKEKAERASSQSLHERRGNAPAVDWSKRTVRKNASLVQLRPERPPVTIDLSKENFFHNTQTNPPTLKTNRKKQRTVKSSSSGDAKQQWTSFFGQAEKPTKVPKRVPTKHIAGDDGNKTASFPKRAKHVKGPGSSQQLPQQHTEIETMGYPVPSHVVSKSERDFEKGDDRAEWIDEGRMKACQDALRLATSHRIGSNDLQQCWTNSYRSPPPSLPITGLDLLTQSFVTADRKDGCDPLWVEKWGIQSVPGDVLGRDRQEIATALLSHVNAWMVRREKAHQCRKERQDALMNKHKRRRRTRNVSNNDDDDDDFLWEDETMGLATVQVLTGPTGSGKTSVIHAIAKQTGCPVLELNTSTERGAHRLKATIEEATQSDSPFDLMQRRELFLNRGDTEPMDTSCMEETGSAVPIILIDEVDNLFENNGDAGFWGALRNVAEKARCPIFLTANDFPRSLVLSSIPFVHHHLPLPDKELCLSFVKDLAQKESFSLVDAQDDALLTFVELFRCDIRRILHCLHLFKNKAAGQSTPLSKRSPSPKTTTGNYTPLSCIEAVTPTQVSPCEPTLVTLKGWGFCRLQRGVDSACAVRFGLLPALPAKVVNDTTILAVCPPYENLTFLPPPATRRYCRFLRVALGGTTSLLSGCLQKGSIVASKHLSVEVAFAPREADEMQLDDEPTLDNQEALLANNLVKHAEYSKKLIDDALANLGNIAASPFDGHDEFVRNPSESASLAEQLSLASDLAMMDDYCQSATLPFLAGAPRDAGDMQRHTCNLKDCYTVTPSSRRERKLFSQALKARGSMTCVPEGLVARDMDHDNETADLCDEDAFLPNLSLCSASRMMSESIRWQSSQPGFGCDDMVLDCRRNVCRDMKARVLTTVMGEELQGCFGARNRRGGALQLPEDGIDCRVVLDYLPMLSFVAMCDKGVSVPSQHDQRLTRKVRNQIKEDNYLARFNSSLEMVSTMQRELKLSRLRY